MTLARWEPFRDLLSIQERMNRLLNDPSTLRHAEEGYGAWMPPVDIFQSADDLVIRAELPGVDRNAIEVGVENGVLTLKGERTPDAELEARNAYRQERTFGPFHRSFTLPTTVDASRIAAKYRDGVLEVVIPKAEAAKPKKVEIEAA